MLTVIQFYSSVELRLMKLYSLTAGNRTICEVEIDAPAWLPVRPRVPKVWLSSVIARALGHYFSPPPADLGWGSDRQAVYWN